VRRTQIWDEKMKSIFKGKLLNIGTEKVKLPNGYVANLEIVEHRGAVLIVPLINKNKAILLSQLSAHICMSFLQERLKEGNLL